MRAADPPHASLYPCAGADGRSGLVLETISRQEPLPHAGTEEHAKALSDAKAVVPITNLAPRKQRSRSAESEVDFDGGEDNSFLTAALFK